MISMQISDKSDFYFLARGINFAIALEGALKLKEVSYIHAEGMPAAELKHGTLALIDKDTPVLAICPDDYTYNDTLSNAMETKARGAFVIGLSDKDNEIFDMWIRSGCIPECWSDGVLKCREYFHRAITPAFQDSTTPVFQYLNNQF